MGGDKNNKNLVNFGPLVDLANAIENFSDVMSLHTEAGLSRPEVPVSESWVADNYGIPVSTIKSYRREGKIKSYKLGKHVFIFVSELNEAIRENPVVEIV